MLHLPPCTFRVQLVIILCVKMCLEICRHFSLKSLNSLDWVPACILEFHKVTGEVWPVGTFLHQFPYLYNESREVEIYDLCITAHYNLFWDWTGRISQISFSIKAQLVIVLVFSGTSPSVNMASSSLLDFNDADSGWKERAVAVHCWRMVGGAEMIG